MNSFFEFSLPTVKYAKINGRKEFDGFLDYWDVFHCMEILIPYTSTSLIDPLLINIHKITQKTQYIIDSFKLCDVVENSKGRKSPQDEAHIQISNLPVLQPVGLNQMIPFIMCMGNTSCYHFRPLPIKHLACMIRTHWLLASNMLSLKRNQCPIVYHIHNDFDH